MIFFSRVRILMGFIFLGESVFLNFSKTQEVGNHFLKPYPTYESISENTKKDLREGLKFLPYSKKRKIPN